MRVFTLRREHDPSGISGLGTVAEGVEFGDGKVALRWRTDTASTALYDSIADVEAIHGHGGATRIEWGLAMSAPDGPTKTRWQEKTR